MAKTIMVTDDHEDIVDTLRTIVKQMAHEPVCSINGRDFLNKVEDANPDLILLDVMMPGLTTREILEELREKGYGHVPVILVTVVKFSPDEREALKDYNVVEIIAKPFSVMDVMDKIRRYLPKY